MSDFLASYFDGSDGERDGEGRPSAGRIALWRGRSSADAHVVAMEWITDDARETGAKKAKENDDDARELEIPVASMSTLEVGSSLKTVPLTSARGEGWRRRLEALDRFGTTKHDETGEQNRERGTTEHDKDGVKRQSAWWASGKLDTWMRSNATTSTADASSMIEEERAHSEPALMRFLRPDDDLEASAIDEFDGAQDASNRRRRSERQRKDGHHPPRNKNEVEKVVNNVKSSLRKLLGSSSSRRGK